MRGGAHRAGTTEPLKVLRSRTSLRNLAIPDAEGRGRGGARACDKSPRKANFTALETVTRSTSRVCSAEVYLEKVVERPRHIEIQIFADTQAMWCISASVNARFNVAPEGNRRMSFADQRF